MKKDTLLCSLYVLNLKPVTRSIGRAILLPSRGGLVRFHAIEHVQYALNLQDNKQVEIKSEIPAHILVQLTGPTAQKLLSRESVVNEPTTKEEAVVEAEPAAEIKPQEEAPAEEIQEEPIVTPAVDEVEPEGNLVEEEVAEEATSEKPAWYLTYEQVEEMSKPQLLEWSDTTEGAVALPKSKNAGDTKALVHKLLAEQFEDHVE